MPISRPPSWPGYWINIPGARAAAERGELAFGTIDTWLLWQLTGGAVHATDVSNAARTMLFDIHRNRWDDALLALFDIPARVLPTVHPSSHVMAKPARNCSAGKSPSAASPATSRPLCFGQACFRAGLAKNTYGTGCFMLMHTGERCLEAATA
jgi:glycerol kinase